MSKKFKEFIRTFSNPQTVQDWLGIIESGIEINGQRIHPGMIHQICDELEKKGYALARLNERSKSNADYTYIHLHRTVLMLKRSQDSMIYVYPN